MKSRRLRPKNLIIDKPASVKVVPSSVKPVKKDKELAVLSFIFGLLVWIPLFNFVLAPLSFYFGIKALILIRRDPDHYGGAFFAWFGIIMGFIIFWLSVQYFFREVFLS